MIQSDDYFLSETVQPVSGISFLVILTEKLQHKLGIAVQSRNV
jgi:hypothetical protein